MSRTEFASGNSARSRRYEKTWAFMSRTVLPGTRVLDLGTPNEFSEIMKNKGLLIQNTPDEDLDDRPELASQFDVSVVTAFEIFEHLLNPLGVLRSLRAQTLYASIPLSLWFAKAYRNKADRWDQHFHEFEDWQFDWLLEKGGWEIVRSEKWTSPVFTPGIRPLLRLFTPRYYIVEARKKS